jgi:hypothetical protein
MVRAKNPDPAGQALSAPDGAQELNLWSTGILKKIGIKFICPEKLITI